MIATVTLNPSLDEWIELDRFTPGSLNRAANFSRYPGGKGLNVSRVIRVLGGATHAFGLAGGADGDILRGLIRRLRIPHTFLPVPGTTRNNYKLLIRRPASFTEINTPGPAASRRVLDGVRRRLAGLRPFPDCLVLSGSLPPSCPSSTYADWIRRFRGRAPVVLDASGAALHDGLAAGPWLIKPNRQEAETALGSRIRGLRGALEAGQALLRRGPSLVILSLGGEGAVLASRAEGRRGWIAVPPKVTVASAVGAGDSLVGGFVHAWAKGRPLVEALRLGVACGSATAMTPGTELCHRADVMRLVTRVKIHRA